MRNQNKKCFFLTIIVLPIIRSMLDIFKELNLEDLKQQQSAINKTHFTSTFAKLKVTTSSTIEMIEREQSRRIDHIRLNHVVQMFDPIINLSRNTCLRLQDRTKNRSKKVSNNYNSLKSDLTPQ